MNVDAATWSRYVSQCEQRWLMKTLFLDFDGVLHPSLPRHEERFSLAPVLAMALSGFQYEIVVSSSWRFQLELAQIRLLLPKPLAARVIGTTGAAVVGRHARHREILAWLEINGPRDWRALDDSAFEFPNQCVELIRCDGARGVRDPELQVLKRWLAT
jgi:HAD domain in Swiss Army Knife RNA repair proteins